MPKPCYFLGVGLLVVALCAVSAVGVPGVRPGGDACDEYAAACGGVDGEDEGFVLAGPCSGCVANDGCCKWVRDALGRGGCSNVVKELTKYGCDGKIPGILSQCDKHNRCRASPAAWSRGGRPVDH